MKKLREFWFNIEETSNLALIRGDGEKWPDDINGEPSKKWTHVRQVSAQLDAAIEECVDAMEYIKDDKNWSRINQYKDNFTHTKFTDWLWIGEYDPQVKMAKSLAALRKARE